MSYSLKSLNGGNIGIIWGSIVRLITGKASFNPHGAKTSSQPHPAVDGGSLAPRYFRYRGLGFRVEVSTLAIGI